MLRKVLLPFAIICIIGCTRTNKTDNDGPLKPSNLSGKILAQTYCAGCHQFPNPNLLDKATWQSGVLPKMYARLGLEQDAFALFSNMNIEEMQIIANSGIYPDKPMIAKEDWLKIAIYYIDNSPIKPLPQDKKEKVKLGLSGFNVRSFFGKTNELPKITLVKFDTTQKQLFLAYRGKSSFVKKYDLKFKQIDSIAVPSPISDISISKEGYQLLAMGIMDPNDQKKGKLLSKSNNTVNVLTIKDSLQRPVNVQFADLNQDKIEDILICNFGNELGKLIWVDGKSKKETILNSLPGARNAYVRDMNGDKLPDIIVLMTQAKEQVIIYYNKGGGTFEEKTVLNFPPVYGSSCINLADFNKDGYLDILYANGDNADLSIALKKYHGIRIFQNNGKNNFKQTYFYPMFGAAKAIAADFDLDGDLDIAAISFFPDNNQKPNEGFIMLRNSGNNQNFKASTFKEAGNGKWMVMDVADMDMDGDLDVLLGSFFKNGMQTKIENSVDGKKLPISIILENKSR